jgi:long-chain acyl-CoA synthetase
MFACGGTAVIMNSAMFFGDVFAALEKYNCTVLQLVPAQVAQILRSAEKLLVKCGGRLKILSVGSAVIPEAHKERLRELLPDVRLFNDFGSTEAIGSAYFEWSAYPPKANCVGTEAKHSRIVFLSEDGKVKHTSCGDPGIVATEGDTLMSGYYDDQALTDEVLKDGRVISSDIGYRGEDDMLYVIGRKTDIIVSGANKISPFEVEDVAQEVPGVAECAMVARPDDIMGQLPVMFIVAEEGFSMEALLETMRNRLENFKVPKTDDIIMIDKLPRTSGTGKIVRQELEERLGCDE